MAQKRGGYPRISMGKPADDRGGGRQEAQVFERREILLQHASYSPDQDQVPGTVAQGREHGFLTPHGDYAVFIFQKSDQDIPFLFVLLPKEDSTHTVTLGQPVEFFKDKSRENL